MSTLMNDTERDECVRLFRDEGKSAKAIAALYKRHPRTIEKMLRRRGIGRRDRAIGCADYPASTTQTPAE